MKDDSYPPHSCAKIIKILRNARQKSLGSYYSLRKNALIIFFKTLFHDAAKPNGKKTIKVDI
jgi:hypothetical protein